MGVENVKYLFYISRTRFKGLYRASKRTCMPAHLRLRNKIKYFLRTWPQGNDKKSIC